MSDFFGMGGYGFYVWSAYGLALFIVVLNLWLPLSCERRLKRSLRRAPRGRKA
jgi:heme exporter protein D